MIGQVDKTYQGSSRVLQEEEGQGSGAGPGRCAGRGATPDHQKVRGLWGWQITGVPGIVNKKGIREKWKADFLNIDVRKTC